MTETRTGSPLKLIRDFFGLTLQEMKNEWTKGGLTDADKAEIASGLLDGTLTY